MHSLAAAFAVALLCSPAFADTSLAFQMRLVHDGFFDGPVDGRVGPATRKAMAAYAAKYGVKNSRAAIEASIVSRAEAERSVGVADDLWVAAIEDAKNSVLDPYSAHFKQLYYFRSKRGNTVVCGLVNAKNLYGAYVGDQYFQTTVLLQDGKPWAVTTIEDAMEMCGFGVSVEDVGSK